MENEFTEFSRLQNLGETMTQHGTQMVLALLLLLVGLFVSRLIDQGFRILMHRLFPKAKFVTIICNIVYVILVAMVVFTSAVQFGAKPLNMLRLLTIISLIVTGVLIFLRPFIPSLPFKVGNTIKVGSLFGKVEAISFLNTRLRTFDGKTFFVPNRQILDDIVINYHYTTTRRVKINVNIHYNQDLLKAKRTLEAIMTADPRVMTKPGPMVYVLKLTANCVELGGRCWVDNKDFWVARCDLFEKAKLGFNREGIRFAYPQLDLHVNPKSHPEEVVGLENPGRTKKICDPNDIDEETA